MTFCPVVEIENGRWSSTYPHVGLTRSLKAVNHLATSSDVTSFAEPIHHAFFCDSSQQLVETLHYHSSPAWQPLPLPLSCLLLFLTFVSFDKVAASLNNGGNMCTLPATESMFLLLQ